MDDRTLLQRAALPALGSKWLRPGTRGPIYKVGAIVRDKYEDTVFASSRSGDVVHYPASIWSDCFEPFVRAAASMVGEDTK